MNASANNFFVRTGTRGLPPARAVSETLERRMLLSAGDVDLTFGTNGAAHASLGAMGSSDVVLAPDGKIVVVASTWGRYDESVALARLHADGAADRSFGPFGSGEAALPVIVPRVEDGGYFDGVWATGLAVQADRKVVVAGGAY